MRASKYNFTVYDRDGNLLLYNFLTGLSSLTKVSKHSVEQFEKLFLTTDTINNDLYESHNKIIDMLVKKGILLNGDFNEEALLDSIHYSEVYNNKLNLVILPTGACNFKCSYCYESSQSFCRESMTNVNQKALLKFAQRNIHKYSGLHVSWFGGEPMLEPGAINYLSTNLIKMCNDRFLPYSSEITTNGYFLNAEMFDMLYRLKVYTYMVTIDGFKDHHDKLRFTADGKGSYDTIIENLLRIRDNKRYKFAHIIIRINMCNGFLDIMNDFVDFLAESFSGDPRFSFRFVPVGLNNMDLNISVNPEELFFRLFENDTYMSKLYNSELAFLSLQPEKKCIASMKNAYVISPDLNVHKCSSFFDYVENKIGYINSKGDLLVDEAKHRQWYLMPKFVKDQPESCKNCFYFPCCRNSSPGCPVRYKKEQPWQSCVVKNENLINQLKETIIFASNKYSCDTIVL